jgi:hypothetical protein
LFHRIIALERPGEMGIAEKPEKLDCREFAWLLLDLPHLQHGKDQTNDNDDCAYDFRDIGQNCQIVHLLGPVKKKAISNEMAFEFLRSLIREAISL